MAQSKAARVALKNFRVKRNSRKKWGSAGYLAAGASLLGFGTLASTLIGFGVALSIETQLGIPYMTLFSSTLDLIGFSAVAFGEYVLVTTSGDSIRDLFWSTLKSAWFPAAFFLGFWLLMVLFRRPIVAFASKHRRAFQTSLQSTGGKLGELKAVIIGVGVAFLLLIVQPIAALLMMAASVAVIGVFSMLPMLGLVTGESYIQKYVVKPKICSGAQASKKDKDPTATCLRIRTKDGQLYLGRHVLSTSSAVVLYSPSSKGKAAESLRIPLNDATVETVTNIADEHQHMP